MHGLSLPLDLGFSIALFITSFTACLSIRPWRICSTPNLAESLWDWSLIGKCLTDGTLITLKALESALLATYQLRTAFDIFLRVSVAWTILIEVHALSPCLSLQSGTDSTGYTPQKDARSNQVSEIRVQTCFNCMDHLHNLDTFSFYQVRHLTFFRTAELTNLAYMTRTCNSGPFLLSPWQKPACSRCDGFSSTGYGSPLQPSGLRARICRDGQLSSLQRQEF